MSRNAVILIMGATGGLSMLGCLAYLLGRMLACWERLHKDRS